MARTKAGKQLADDVSRDLDQWQGKLFQKLVQLTPIDTGQAQKGWKDVYPASRVAKTGQSRVIIRNDVEYIQRLDEGWSRQAPRGIVQPAIDQTRRRK